ncbi:GRF1-interacting factor 3 [Linum perenne]
MAILEHQSVGKAAECALLQAKLQENLMYLAKIADAQPPPPQPHGTPQPQQQQQLQGTLQPLQAQQWSSIQQEQLQQHYLMQASQGQGEWQQQQHQPSMYLGPKHPFPRSHQG